MQKTTYPDDWVDIDTTMYNRSGKLLTNPAGGTPVLNRKTGG